MDASYKRILYEQIQKGGPGCLCLFSQMVFSIYITIYSYTFLAIFM